MTTSKKTGDRTVRRPEAEVPSGERARPSFVGYGATGLLIALVGLCGWLLHDALERHAPARPVADTSTVTDQRSDPAPTINLTLVPAQRPVAAPHKAHHHTHRSGGAGVSRNAVARRAASPAADLTTSRRPALVLVGGPGQPVPGTPPVVDQPVDVGDRPGSTGPQVLATEGSIVYIGANGRLTANTGRTDSSGVVALDTNGSSLSSGESRSAAGSSAAGPGAAAPGGGPEYSSSPAHANGSLVGLLAQSQGASGLRSMAVSGFEDHSVSVLGNDQIVTYDDSNVFIARNGQINANTGDTDSSGLNAVDITGSRVRSGNSGDGEGDDEGDEEDEEEVPVGVGGVDGSTAPSEGTSAQPAAADDQESSPSSDDEDGDDDSDGGAGSGRPAGGQPFATVTDEGASTATGPGSSVIGADGYDDVSIRSQGDRDVVTYDDSNVVLGGTGNVNAQIGDSDTGGAVVMGVHNSDVQAGCEGDLCYSH